MAVTKRDDRKSEKKSRRTAITDEGRENQLISLAMDLAERQLRDGTATSQVMTEFIKAGSAKAKLERERLENENLMLRAKVDQLASSSRIEEMYREAIKAMRGYSGRDEDEDDEDDGSDYGYY